MSRFYLVSDELVVLEHGFFQSNVGSLRVASWSVDDPQQRTVVLIPPFGEEMNVCRYTLATLARGLAQLGHQAILFDLPGTGESAGDATDFGFTHHVDSLVEIASAASSSTPPHILSIRQGFLTAVAAIEHGLQIDKHITWAPVLSGRDFLEGLLRQKLFAERLNGNHNVTLEQLYQTSISGSHTAVGGTWLASQFASEIDSWTRDRVLGLPVEYQGWVLDMGQKSHLDSYHDILPAYSYQHIGGDDIWSTPEHNAEQAIDATIAVLQ